MGGFDSRPPPLRGLTSAFAAEGPRLLSGNISSATLCYSFATHPFGMGSTLLQMTKPPGVSRGLQCSDEKRCSVMG